MITALVLFWDKGLTTYLYSYFLRNKNIFKLRMYLDPKFCRPKTLFKTKVLKVPIWKCVCQKKKKNVLKPEKIHIFKLHAIGVFKKRIILKVKLISLKVNHDYTKVTKHLITF
jgi:hypothetical protein